MAVSEISKKERGAGGRDASSSSSVRLEYHWTLLTCSFSLTSIAAYGVNPHIKSVSAETGQDRPRPRFPAGEKQNRSFNKETKVLIKLFSPVSNQRKKKKKEKHQVAQ